MQTKNRDHKKKWTALVAGWQAQVDRARAAQQRTTPEGTSAPTRSVATTAPSTTTGRGFLDGHRRPGVYPRFTQRLGTRGSAAPLATSNPITTMPAAAPAPKIYVHEVSFPAPAAPAAVTKASVFKRGEHVTIDGTQKLYKCPQVPLVINPFCEYLSGTTKKRISSPNTLNSVLHFASVVTLIVAQIVLLGTWFFALAPRARATRAFFQEIHQPVYQEDTEKREALIANWQRKVNSLSAAYSTGLVAYVLLMVAFAASTGAYFWTRRPQDPWWGWLNWAKSARDAWAFVTGRVAVTTGARTPISVDSFRSFPRE